MEKILVRTTFSISHNVFKNLIPQSCYELEWLGKFRNSRAKSSNLNPFPNTKILDRSKLKAFADHKIYMTEKLELNKGRKQREKGKMLVTSIFSFSHNFFKRLPI